MTPLPTNYYERVYAGILGKIIGVYLGQPLQGWTYERLMGELGDVRDYVNDRVDTAGSVVVTDDDVTGTFTFVRALDDYAASGRDVSAEQIGKAWLNYIIEERNVLWWGGIGVGTEHTAFLRLKNGVMPPRSGSIELNGKTVAEQLGAQTLIDGWALASPGDPVLATTLATRAASVSHDGEAIHAAALIAAMEAQAFLERDINKLIDVGLGFIPTDSTVRRLVDDLRRWRNKSDDWRSARAQLDVNHGYHRYPGTSPVIPNLGVVLMALLFGNGDFTDSLSIAATAGWATGGNSGNVGCLLGIRNGLTGIRDRWRDPVNDLMLLPTADGGSCLTDALSQAVRLSNIGRILAGQTPTQPKEGARFHFSMPGSRQGFTVAPITSTLSHESNRLRAMFRGAARVSVDTFITPEQAESNGHHLVASPTLYPGQRLRARVIAPAGAACAARFDIGTYYGDAIARRMGPRTELKPGDMTILEWVVPDFGEPIASVGVSFDGVGPAEIDSITWSGSPDCSIGRPKSGGTLWRRAWVNACTHFHDKPSEDFTLVQNCGRGLLICGTRDWQDYEVSATIIPRLAASFGLAARVQGINRYYALLLGNDGKARNVRALDEITTLAEADMQWALDKPISLSMTTIGTRVIGQIEGKIVIEATDSALAAGGIAFVLEEGSLGAGPVRIVSK